MKSLAEAIILGMTRCISIVPLEPAREGGELSYKISKVICDESINKFRVSKLKLCHDHQVL